MSGKAAQREIEAKLTELEGVVTLGELAASSPAS
jgi:hypothetical protein